MTKARQSHVFFSDDHGRTWKLGGVVGPNCNESQVVELTDGSLMLNMRSYEANHRRLIATSRDAGVTWSAPVEDPALIEPVLPDQSLGCLYECGPSNAYEVIRLARFPLAWLFNRSP